MILNILSAFIIAIIIAILSTVFFQKDCEECFNNSSKITHSALIVTLIIGAINNIRLIALLITLFFFFSFSFSLIGNRKVGK